MPDFSKRYNQNEIVTDYDAQRAAMAGRVLPVRHRSSRPSINTSKFETEYQNFIKKLKEQKAQEQEQEAVVETVEEPVVEAPKPKKKKAKVVPVDEQVVADTVVPEETPAEEQPELPTFDLD
jgi:hypothetical protein